MEEAWAHGGCIKAPSSRCRLASTNPARSPDFGRCAWKSQRRPPELHRQEFQLPNLTLEPSRTYTLSFWIKADAARAVYVDVSAKAPTTGTTWG